jgi:hypothetical protein
MNETYNDRKFKEDLNLDEAEVFRYVNVNHCNEYKLFSVLKKNPKNQASPLLCYVYN